MDKIKLLIEYSAKIIEFVGVIVIVSGILYALFIQLITIKKTSTSSYKVLRQNIGKSILLGLEILVAGDIIATVVTEPTFESVISLAIIVLIRTFLSLSMEVEIEGFLPWKKLSDLNKN